MPTKKTRSRPSSSRSRKPAPAAAPARRTAGDKPRLYTLEVFLLTGPITAAFAKKNPVVSRTIKIRGDQTLQDLHQAIFDAHQRWDQHFYEFQFGKGPMDPKGPTYVLPEAFDTDKEAPPAGCVDETTLDSLGLEVGRSFGYWFDYGDDWWHQIDVVAIDDKVPPGKYPKVTKRVGESPPQYTDEDEDDEGGEEDEHQ